MNKNRTEFESLCDSGEAAGPVAVGEIERAEAELGVLFPPEYRDFLQEFGALIADGVSIFGLPKPELNDPPFWGDVVSETRRLRNINQAGADQKNFIPISEDGTGIYFFLDTRVYPATQIWAVGPGVEKVISSDFGGFFVDLSLGNIII